MSVAKIGLVSDLGTLALYPFKRLFIQPEADAHHQAASDYSNKLRQLYRASVLAKLDDSTRQELDSESAILRLDGSLLEATKRLHGLTIERASFPSGQPNEPIVLVEAAAESGESGPILAHGLIQAVTKGEIKIKLLEPLILVQEEEKNAEQAAGPATSDEPSGSEETSEKPQNSDDNDDSDKPDQDVDGTEIAAESSETAKQERARVINFTIKYNVEALKEANINNLTRYDSIVMGILFNFQELKCDSVIHRSLLGIYDERFTILHERTRLMTFGELAQPKGQQRLAIEQAIKRRMSLIEGPAGSGKTLVAAHIAANMSRLKRAKVLVCSPIQASVDKLAQLIDKIDGIKVVRLPDGPVRLNLTEMLEQGQLKQLRSGSSDGLSSLLEPRPQSSHYHLDKLVEDEIYLQAWNRSKGTLGNHHEALHSHAYRMVATCSQYRRRKIEAKVLKESDIVCCTNKQAGSYLSNGFHFDMLIQDDVQVSSEIDCLAAIMVKGIKQVVLISESRKRIRLARTMKKSQSNSQMTRNHVEDVIDSGRQNGSRSSENSLRRKSYWKSKGSSTGLNPNDFRSDPSLEAGGLFERLIAIGLPTVDFRVQFRMHGTLSNFVNHHFYLGRLKDDPETNSKLANEIETRLLLSDEKRFDWLPSRKYLTAMFNVKSCNRNISSSSSSTSSIEQENIYAQNMQQMIEKLNFIVDKLVLHENIQESQIGIVVNRRVDREAAWAKKIHNSITLGTIADFIGQERDFMILMVLPIDYSGMNDESAATIQLSICSEIPCDFKHDDGALNCALTRARLGMLLIATDITVDEKAGSNSDPGIRVESSIESATSNGSRGWIELVQYYKASGLLV